MKQVLTQKARQAFTLIELITVMAITAVLLTIIVVPMIQSFNYVRQAQAFADAQEKGRLVLERISREISNSAGVRDNSGVRGACDVVVPDSSNVLRAVRLPYTKLDIVKPAQSGYADANGILNPDTGKYDPTLKSKKGQIVLPVAPGTTIVRYFIGLRDPFGTYTNPYDGLLMARSGLRDNLYVLYRAEVNPYVYSGGTLVANQRFFEVDANGAPILDDPAFFLNDGGAAKAVRIGNWLKEATIVTELSRYDMIMPVYDKRTRQVVYEPNGLPRLLALIQFKPARVSSEPAEGMEAVRQGEESEGMDQFASGVFKTKLAGWANVVVRAFGSGWSAGQPYQVARDDGLGNTVLYYYDPAGGDDLSTGVELFSISEYERAVQSNAPADKYPFSRALNTGNLASAVRRAAFMPFYLNSHSGKVVSSFGIHEVGQDTGIAGNNLPQVDVGPSIVPDIRDGVIRLPGNWNDYTTINERFVKVWEQYPQLRPYGVHRYIDLRVVPNLDGTPSPLHPDPAIGFPRATIVPGSEVVTGPSQSMGASMGTIVRYTRTTGRPGPNQYRINYVNLPEPSDYSLLGLNNPPANYDPNNFESAVIQPRYKVGYIELYSEPTVPIPTGNITVSYRFQFTRPGDTIAVDYDSRQMIEILLTMRNFPQTSAPNPQGVTLKTTATVRNYLR